MTVFRDSIHIGSMSPSSRIHLGPSWVMLESSRMTEENNPKRNHGYLNFQVTIKLLPLKTAFSYQLQHSEGGVHRQVRSGFVTYAIKNLTTPKVPLSLCSGPAFLRTAATAKQEGNLMVLLFNWQGTQWTISTGNYYVMELHKTFLGKVFILWNCGLGKSCQTQALREGPMWF